MATTFQKDLEKLLNGCSAEAPSGTPDFILAEYLVDCLRAYDRAVAARERWYGRTVDEIAVRASEVRGG